MFAIEFTILVIGVLLLMLFSLARDWLRMRRRRRLGDETESHLKAILHKSAADAEAALGPVDEVNEGLSGRKLFVWRRTRPEGLLTMMATVSEAGTVESVSWKLNRNER